MTQTEMARQLGIAQPTLSAYAQRGCPIDSVEAARAWMDANLSWRRRKGVRAVVLPPGAGGGVPASLVASTSSRLADQRLRREQAEADLAELKLGELRQQLVRVDDVRTAHARRLVGLREALLQLPSRLSALLAAEADPARVHELLATEIHQTLEQAAQAA